MIDISELKFDEKGLIPAIVVDSRSKQVLTLAYMSRESLQISLERELTCFWSRSRQELWLKGETSGNYQHIVSITADCDRDALVVKVEKDGPACHTGTESCFNDVIWESDELHEFTYEGLMELIAGRKTEKKEGSYTTYLFEKGLDKDFSLNYEADLERTYEAIVFSIKEYFSKNGFERAVLGLSGGLDSSVCAVLLADALGKEQGSF